MMDFTEKMIEQVALTLHGSTKVHVGDHEIDFESLPRVPMFDAIEKETGHNLYGKSLEELRPIAKELHIQMDEYLV